jgi:hypothetical protein
MNKNPLIPALVTAVSLLASLNFLISAWSHRLPYYHKLEEIRTAQYPNLLFVGNSLLDGHLDEAAFNHSSPNRSFKALNSALGASMPPEQQLLFEYAVQNHCDIRTVVVGTYDFQLTAPDHTRPGDLTGNRMVGIDKRFPVSEVASVYGFGPVDTLELQMLRRLPMAANRANIWKNVELLRRSMGSIGMPRVDTNSMGRVADFAALESGSFDAFDTDARSFLAQPDHFNASYESIFRQARQNDMNVVIVIMPISPYHRATFYARPVWHEYLNALQQLAGQRGIQVIDASDWFPSEQDFADHLHMTVPAARVFSSRLGERLTQSLGQ